MLLVEQGKRSPTPKSGDHKATVSEMLEAPASEPRSVWMMAVTCAAVRRNWFVTETQILGGSVPWMSQLPGTSRGTC